MLRWAEKYRGDIYRGYPMTAKIKLSDIINTFKNAYRSIEIRAAFVRENQSVGTNQIVSHWHNLFTVMRFDSGSVIESANEICLDGPNIKFIVWRYLFNDSILNGLIRGFSEQNIGLNRISNQPDYPSSISLNTKYDLMGQEGSLYPIYREQYNEKYPLVVKIFQSSAMDKARSIFQNDSDISRSIESMNHDTPESALKEFLRVNFSPILEPRDNFHLVFKIPFKIDDVKMMRNSSEGFDLKIFITTEIDTERNLKCLVRQKLSNGIINRSNHLLNLPPVQTDKQQAHLGLWIWKTEDRLVNDLDSIVEVDLFHERLGKIDTYSKPLKELLIQEDRNPLFIALTAFCPRATLTEILESPSKFSSKAIRDPQNNIGRLYEVTIQWLLTLMGLRSIWLHSYEDLKTESSFQLGSVDCIAYSDQKNVLLLIGCTTNAPTSEEIKRLENLRKHFLKNVFKGDAIKIYALLFTGAHKPSSENIPSSDEETRVYYKEDISGLLDYAAEGKGDSFIEEVMHFTVPTLPISDTTMLF